MNIWEAIRIQALKTVMEPTVDFELRKKFRWYSRTFHTPLKEVEELPVEEVIRTYWETAYDDMTEGELEYEISALVADEQEVKKAEDAEEEEVRRLLEEAALENQQVEKATEKPPPPPDINVTFVDGNLSDEDLEKLNKMR